MAVKSLNPEEYLEAFQEKIAEVTSSREAALDFFQKVGTHDEHGNLTKNYKPPSGYPVRPH